MSDASLPRQPCDRAHTLVGQHPVSRGEKEDISRGPRETDEDCTYSNRALDSPCVLKYGHRTRGVSVLDSPAIKAEGRD